MRHEIRVIGGQWRGRKIQVLDQAGLRPTLGRVRETLFNWLMLSTHDACCLDAFAGTGALGIEALSRGAKSVTFIEKNKIALAAIQKSLIDLKAQRYQLLLQDVCDYLAVPSAQSFDLIFLDPPFRQGLLKQALDQIKQGSWSREGGIIYFECESELDCAELESAGWQLIKHQQAGQSQYGLIQKGVS